MPKKVLKTHVILIICSEVLLKKLDYVECLVHGGIFSKNSFPEKSPFFADFTVPLSGVKSE